MKLNQFVIDAIKSICSGANGGGALAPDVIHFDVAMTGDADVAVWPSEVRAQHRIKFSCYVDWQNDQDQRTANHKP